MPTIFCVCQLMLGVSSVCATGTVVGDTVWTRRGVCKLDFAKVTTSGSPLCGPRQVRPDAVAAIGESFTSLVAFCKQHAATGKKPFETKVNAKLQSSGVTVFGYKKALQPTYPSTRTIVRPEAMHYGCPCPCHASSLRFVGVTEACA